MKSHCTLLTRRYCLAIISVVVFSLSLVTVNGQSIFFPWNEDLTPRTEFSGRYAFRMYQVIPEKQQLCLLTNDSRLVIYSLDQPESPITSYQMEGLIELFHYSDGYFYCIRQEEILKVDSRSFKVSLAEQFVRPDEFFLQFYYEENGKHYFLTSDEKTYILKDGQLELIDEKAWKFKGNNRVYAEVNSSTGANLSLASGPTRTYVGEHFNSSRNSKILTIVPIGFSSSKMFLDVELEDGDTIPTRILITMDQQGNILKQSEIPFIYYIDLPIPWSIAGDHIYYMLTTEEGFYLIYDGDFSDINMPKLYHYNYSLPRNRYEGVDSTQVEDHGRVGSNCVTRTQIYFDARKYLLASWVATSSNWVSSCTTIPGGTSKYRTPISYSSNGSKISTPYKWGGFTKWTDWLNFVSEGKKTGNYFTSNNSVCSGTAYSSELDTYIIGLDCSGLVSRAWEKSTKYSTETLPGISTYLGLSNTSSGFSALKKGDIINKAGSHTRICTNDNPTGTAIFLEASADNWNVRSATYSYTALSGYKSYRYNNVSDNRLKLAQTILLSPTTVNKNCPLTVIYSIKNEGSESWSGKILLVLIQSNGVEVGLAGPYSITLNPNQTSSVYTYSSPAFNYPTGTSKLEVRVKNNSTCNYQLYYPVESNGSYANPKIFTIYNNCSAPPSLSNPVIITSSNSITISLEVDDPADIIIYDATGKIVKSFKCEGLYCEFELGALPGGLYMASIIQNGRQLSIEKILIPE